MKKHSWLKMAAVALVVVVGVEVFKQAQAGKP